MHPTDSKSADHELGDKMKKMCWCHRDPKGGSADAGSTADDPKTTDLAGKIGIKLNYGMGAKKGTSLN